MSEPTFCDHDEVHTMQGLWLVTWCRRCPAVEMVHGARYSTWPELGPWVVEQACMIDGCSSKATLFRDRFDAEALRFCQAHWMEVVPGTTAKPWVADLTD